MLKLENFRTVVFGGSGFLGSHTADALTAAGHEVTIFDCEPSSWLRDGQEMIVGDILNKQAVADAIAGVDVVYNFAGFSDLNTARELPRQTVDLNIIGNLNILDGCLGNNIKRFIYASTVYVNSREGGFYRCSKKAAEDYIREYYNMWGLEYTILRYGSLYGSRSDSSNGLYKIVETALKENKIVYQGHADTMRQYIHVIDAAKSSVVALGDEFLNECVVLTGQEPMRVEDLLKMVAEIIGFDQNSIEFEEKKYAGHYIRTPYAFDASIGKKYCPTFHVDLGQGLLELIQEVNSET